MQEQLPGIGSRCWERRHAVFVAWYQLHMVRWRFARNVLKFSCAVPFPRDNSTLDPMECMDTAEEQRVHSPPASLVPRIHVILAQKLQHINPLLPACLNEEESKTCEYLNLTSFNVDVNVHLASTYEQLLLASDSCTSEQRFVFKSF